MRRALREDVTSNLVHSESEIAISVVSSLALSLSLQSCYYYDGEEGSGAAVRGDDLED